MISVDIQRKAFGAREILKEIHFTMGHGETVAILGASGIGKSTLLRIVAGIDTDFDGAITRPQNVAMVFQEPVLLPWRSVLDNLLLVHGGLDEAPAFAMLERVGIVAKARDYPGQLSLGQQRRLALARAFVGKPELLIMDEPYVSLDPVTANDMLELTEALMSDIRPAVMLVTHSKVDAERLSNRCLALEGLPASLTLVDVANTL